MTVTIRDDDGEVMTEIKVEYIDLASYFNRQQLMKEIETALDAEYTRRTK